MQQQTTRREMLSRMAQFGLGAAAMSVLQHVHAAEPGNRPNVVFIMSDDHAAHALSCYGSRINKTPNLDRIAHEGMRLENCFVTNAICGPSRACILTGKYGHINGYHSNDRKFNGDQQTFPKLLQKAGYQTAMVGKWHLGTDPTGFDFWTHMPQQGRYRNPEFIEMGKRITVRGYVTDIITDKAINFIKNRDVSKPFFLMYQHKAPHREWTPDAAHATMYEDRDIPLPETFDDDYATRGRAAKEQQMTVEKHLTKTDLKQDPPAGLSGQQLKQWKYQRYLKDYLKCVASLDDNIGRFLDYLDESGLSKNTIVIYTTDNGFFLGDHGWYDKRFMYEHAIRVPFLIRYPGRIKPGTVSKDIIINCDYAPTFLDYAGVDIPGDIQGRSMRPILEGNTPADWRQSMYYRYYEFPGPHRVHPHYGVRTHTHKLMYFNTIDEWEMYDLVKDPNELKNVYADPAYAEVREELRKELQRLRVELKDSEP